MADTRTREQRRKIMQAVKGADTAPEKAVRRLLHRAGYRYRLHDRLLPGTPDIVFHKRRRVIMVHGCFWHGHGCAKGLLPKSRPEYWGPKIAQNRERDARNQSELEAAGWQVAVIWQCEIKELEPLLLRLKRFLGPIKKSIDMKP